MPLPRPLSHWFDPGGHERTLVAFGRSGERSRGELERDVAALTASLESIGAGRWLVLTDDRYAAAVSLLALARCRGVAVLPPNRQPETLQRAVRGATGILFDAVGDGDPAQDTFSIPMLAPLGHADAEPKAPLKFDRNVAWIEFQTSGTSGDSRPIVKALRHLEDEVAVLEARLGELFASDPRIFATASHQHIYGLLFAVLWPLAAGRAFQRESLLHRQELVPRMAGCASAVLVTTPATLKRLTAGAGLRELRGICRCVTSSGGPLDAAVARSVADQLGAAPVEVFGSTETGGVALRRRDGHGETWEPLPGVEVRRCEPDGHLEVTSAFASVGTELPDGRTCSPMGDRIQWAAGGGFELLGRADRVVKIAEKRLSLAAMEQLLAAHAWIAEAAVLVRELAGENRVYAAVVPSSAGQAALVVAGRREFRAELLRHVVTHFDPVLAPRAWRIVAALPRDRQDKVSKAALQALFGEREATARPEAARLLAEERRDESLERTLEVPHDLAQLDGHFEGFPVVAGVVQLRWVFDAAADWLGRPPHVAQLEALKFPQPLRPGAVVTLRLERIGGGFRFSLYSDVGIFASGRVVVQAAEAS